MGENSQPRPVPHRRRSLPALQKVPDIQYRYNKFSLNNCRHVPLFTSSTVTRSATSVLQNGASSSNEALRRETVPPSMLNSWRIHDDMDNVLSEQQLTTSLNEILKQTARVSMDIIKPCLATKQSTTDARDDLNSSWPFPFSHNPEEWNFEGRSISLPLCTGGFVFYRRTSYENFMVNNALLSSR